MERLTAKIEQNYGNYGDAGLDFSRYPMNTDPHRCGTAPFVPQIIDGEQNSCGSYCAGFDKKGCNKYLNNYPDDVYLQNYSGDCSDFKDCKRKMDTGCPGECKKDFIFGMQNNATFPVFLNTVENFDTSLRPHSLFESLLLLLFVILLFKIVFFGCNK
jgi:hypothetical protein